MITLEPAARPGSKLLGQCHSCGYSGKEVVTIRIGKPQSTTGVSLCDHCSYILVVQFDQVGPDQLRSMPHEGFTP